MREIALAEAKNNLSSLVSEVEETGIEIVITRHGRPAAKLAPAVPAVSLQEREAIFRRVGANAEAWGVQHPEAAAPVPWEQVKAWMEEDR